VYGGAAPTRFYTESISGREPLLLVLCALAVSFNHFLIHYCARLRHFGVSENA
jgi:hypothetical protein